MAKVVQFTQVGGPEVLDVVDVVDPTPGPGHVAVRVEAAGVNPLDIKLRSGRRPLSGDGPWRAGADGAGSVTAVGEGVDGFRVGDPVAFFGANGAYATDVVVDASQVCTRPAGVSAAQGAALGIPAGTAYQVLKSLSVGEDDTVLVHGASGSVGQAITQFAVLFGARVIGTTSDQRADRVRDLGADPIRYGDGLTGRVLEAAPDGVDAIIDCAGADGVLETSLELLDDTSRITSIVLGAKAEELGMRAFLGGASTPMTAQQLAWRAEALPVSLALMAAGYFDVELGDAFPLERAGDAQAANAEGVPGKQLVVP